MKHAALVVLATAIAGGTAFAQPLSLEDALWAADVHSPRLAAQRHAVTAAEHQSARAGALPDPRLRLGIENLPVTGPDRYRYGADFMTAGVVGVAQEFPNAAKREARAVRAERLRQVEGANLQASRAALQRDVAAAWLELHFAERGRAALERLARQIGLQSDAVPSAIARGRQGPADAFILRQALEETNDRLIEQDRMIARARIMLATWIADEARRPLGTPPDTSRVPQPAEALLERLAEQPQLRVLERREALARAEVDMARTDRRTDWMLEVEYGQRRPYFDNMLTVMVSFPLSLWRGERQDRDVASRLAELEQARAMQEDARRMREAEVRGWVTDFETAARRVARFQSVLLPLARERSAAAQAAYRGGRGELGPVLEAERSIAETELALVQTLAERARAWANLSFLFAPEAP
jgi:outer membrane protein TolC